jgi:S-disulfanyl-L-cysteine oxidoreductase SoxD
MQVQPEGDGLRSGSMVNGRFLRTAAVFCAVYCFGVPAQAQESLARTPTIWDGVFTQGQADRGKEKFGLYCAQCHKPDLTGETGPELAGNRFRTSWDSATLDELFTKILKTMPRGSANLSPETVTDVITYILAMNNFPPGDRNLPTVVDSLGRIRILGKEGPMPAEVGQLVRTIGCLAPGPSNGWVLTSAVPPERSRQSEPSAHSEISAMAARSLGDRTIRLVSVDPDAQENKGQRVEVKGLLGQDEIVVTSLQRIAEHCQ